MKTPVRSVALLGLALGGVFGLLGTFMNERNLQSAAWAIDGVGLTVATALLAVHFGRRNREMVAAGFMVFAIGEAVMLVGTAASLAESTPSFAAGTALWAAALFMTCLPKEFRGWIRCVGIVGGVLFAITSARIFWGEPLSPISKPLPFFGYPLLVATLAGWIWTLLRDSEA